MNKSVIYGLILIILTLTGMFYWFRQTIPSQQAIQSIVRNIKPVDLNLLSQSTVSTLKSMEKNGEIPVTTINKGIGKNDPFQ